MINPNNTITLGDEMLLTLPEDAKAMTNEQKSWVVINAFKAYLQLKENMSSEQAIDFMATVASATHRALIASRNSELNGVQTSQYGAN